MFNEYTAIIKNETWELVPRLLLMLFLASGFQVSQTALLTGTKLTRWPGVSTDNPTLIMMRLLVPWLRPLLFAVLTIVVSCHWPSHQLDVANAFLHGPLCAPDFCEQPSGFVDPERPYHACRFHKALYGLKQAPRAWF